MARREILYAKDMEALLSDHPISIEAINLFLSFYSAKANYKSAIHDLLFNQIEILDVTELTIEHYESHIPQDRELNSQQSYKNRFFQFLYSMDYLRNPNGFERHMHKESLLKEFSTNNVKPKNIKNEEKALTIEELMQIQNVIEAVSTKHETLKMQFCWFAIFELGLPIDEVRKSITSDNFSNGALNTSLGSFSIPEKYNQMFIQLSQEHHGFATLDVYIANIGKDAKLKRKLIPIMIKQARTNSMVKCGNCFESYPNLAHNWRSINNRIVCVDCANKLKKN